MNALQFFRHVVLPGTMPALLTGMRATLSISWPVVNCSSPTLPRSTAHLAAYALAKGGVDALTRFLAREMGAQGVRVNAVLPGWAMTERQRDLWLTPEAERSLMDAQCLKRLVSPEDVARMVLFLASDDSAAMTGPIHMVDAGLT